MKFLLESVGDRKASGTVLATKVQTVVCWTSDQLPPVPIYFGAGTTGKNGLLTYWWLAQTQPNHLQLLLKTTPDRSPALVGMAAVT